jgi:hypothetical protein
MSQLTEELKRLRSNEEHALAAWEPKEVIQERLLHLEHVLELSIMRDNEVATPAPEPKKRAAPKCSNCQQEGHRKPYCPGIIKGTV